MKKKLAPRHFDVLVASASALALALALPLPAFAQTSNGPETRAQVLQHLYDLEDLGYRPAQASSLRFPYDIEAAEERLAEKKRTEASRSDAAMPSDASGIPQATSSTAR
ncbi:protein of unknown function [Burkholderia sp. YR290]|jgi:hypothetical protein|nr:protein of unknown function [Burkholderia sp. YR290]